MRKQIYSIKLKNIFLKIENLIFNYSIFTYTVVQNLISLPALQLIWSICKTWQVSIK
jgi:hypothetical protein